MEKPREDILMMMIEEEAKLKEQVELKIEYVPPKREFTKPPDDWKPEIKKDAWEECGAKFGRFKKLCLDIDPGNEWITYFNEKVDLRLFLFTIKAKLTITATQDSIYKEILETAKLDDEVVGKNRDRVKLYISYFLEIVKSMV